MSASAARPALLDYARRQLPRVLTQMDRDPDSPTFGCFDRNYWHYKVRDFPSSILQQGAFAIEALRCGWLEGAGGETGAAIAASWCVAAVNALGRQVGRRGGVDEYYPGERSFPAAAFGLWTAARLSAGWRVEAPPLHAQIDWEPLARLARGLAARSETAAANQQAAALAGLSLAAGLDELRAAAGDVGPHAARFFAAQHAEGWFPEYGGPDFGYLTVTLDALADLHDATGDPRALAAADRAIDFLAAMVGADGRLPSTLNSRNTDYVVPYGLARAAARSPRAAWLVETLFAGAADPGHFLWATDDRYHAHYVYASCVRALPHLERMLAPEPPPQAPRPLWLPGCGHLVHHARDGEWTAYVAARKGGVVRIHRRDDPPVRDDGWRIGAEGRGRLFWTTSWWSDAWQIEREADEVTIRGRCHEADYLVPHPWRHALLRVAARLLGPRLLPWLRRRMIFRPGAGTGPPFERRIEIADAGVAVRDWIEGAAHLAPHRAPRQNLRHVASADSFSAEELAPLIAGPGARDAGGTFLAGWTWSPGSGGERSGAEPPPAERTAGQVAAGERHPPFFSYLILFFVLSLAATLFAYGISWGLPSARGWAGDEILPETVNEALHRGFAAGWHEKYPPLHYYLLALVQAPLRALWRGALSWREVNHLLMLAGRWLSVALSLGTVYLTYRAGREVSGHRGAVLAALIVVFTPPLVYFAKTANVEAPMLFWLALALWLFLRVFRRHRPRDWVLLAVAATLAVATKDQAYGFFVLAPLALLPSLAAHRRARGLPAGARTLLDRRPWLALAAGLLAFTLAFNLPGNWRGFRAHVRTLAGPGAAAGEAREYAPDLEGQLQNLRQNVRHLAFCLGWPLFGVCLAGVARALRRRREPRSRRLLALQLLGFSYYAAFLAPILFSRDRYSLPLVLPLALAGGRLLGDLLAPGRRLRLAAAAVLAALSGWSGLRALAVDLRMANDSRYAAEAWLAAHGAPPRRALAVGRPRHVPRIRRLDWEKVHPGEGRRLARRHPDFVVINVTDLRTPRERRIHERLLSGELGYRRAASCHWTSPWDRLETRGSLTTLDLVNPRLEIFAWGAGVSEEQPLDGSLDGPCRGARVRGVADRTPDDDVVGTREEGLLDRHHALLVVARAVLRGPDAGRHDQQPLAQLLAQPPRLASRGDDAVAAERERAPGAREDQRLDVQRVAHGAEVGVVEARQHRHRQDLEVVALGAQRGLEDRVVAVHRGEGEAAAAQPPDRRADGRRHVVELEVGEDLVAALAQPVGEREGLAAHEQLEAELVEADRVAQRLDQPPRRRRRRHVESDDQPLLGRDLPGREEARLRRGHGAEGTTRPA